MKKLLKFMACALAVSFGLTACDDGQDPHHPWDSGYKPKGSQLNTSHKLVGEMYGVDGVVTNNADAQGIVFAVSKDGKTAYLVAFTDAMKAGDTGANNLLFPDYYNCNADGYFAPERQWGPARAFRYDTIISEVEENGVKRNDTVIKGRAVIHDVDGEVNTTQILENFRLAEQKDSTFTLPVIYAAKTCREYYRREWSKKVNDAGVNGGDDQIGASWAYTKGEWYLPSIEELGDLMKNRDKINKRYSDSASDFVNERFFMPIGGENGHAYWSSSEFNVQCAWYCLSRVGDGTGYPGNKRYGYAQKNDKKNMYVRPIRKAPIK